MRPFAKQETAGQVLLGGEAERGLGGVSHGGVEPFYFLDEETESQAGHVVAK